MIKLLLCAVLLACLIPLPALSLTMTEFTYTTRVEFSLADGVTFRQMNLTPISRSAGMSQRIFLVEADPSVNPNLRIRYLLGQNRVRDNLTQTSQMTKAALKTMEDKFLFSFNGDFFDEGNGGPVGCNLKDGEWLTLGEFYDGWSVGFNEKGEMIIGQPHASLQLSVVRDGKLLMDNYHIPALNAPRADKAEKSIPQNVVTRRQDNDCVLYTPRFDASTYTQGGTEFVLAVDGVIRSNQTISGTVLTVYGTNGKPENNARKGLPLEEGTMVLSCIGDAAETFSSLREGDRVFITCLADPVFDEAVVITGGGRPDDGPLLIQNGKRTDLTEPAALAATSQQDGERFYSHHARTIAAYREDGSWFILSVEGYRTGSYGMQLEWAQTLLLDLGAVMAVNLDGGPSATLVTPVQNSAMPYTRTDNSGGSRGETRVGNALMLVELTQE